METPEGYVMCLVVANGLPIKLCIQCSAAGEVTCFGLRDGDFGKSGWWTTSALGRFEGDEKASGAALVI